MISHLISILPSCDRECNYLCFTNEATKEHRFQAIMANATLPISPRIWVWIWAEWLWAITVLCCLTHTWGNRVKASILQKHKEAHLCFKHICWYHITGSINYYTQRQQIGKVCIFVMKKKKASFVKFNILSTICPPNGKIWLHGIKFS